MSERESLIIPKFDGDYEHWAMLMENLLRSKEWWQLIETGIVAVEPHVILTGAQRTERAEMIVKDHKVKNYLFASIDKTTLKTILKKNTAKELWDSMKKKYQGNQRVQSAQLQRLRRTFEILEMKMEETITEYFSRVMEVANDMRNLGENVPDSKVVEKILRTLVEKFTYVVCAIEESNNVSELTVDELQSSLMVHEQNLNRHGGEERALKMESHWQSFYRGRGRSNARGGFQSRGRGNSRYNKEEIECFKCRKRGHFKSECPEWEKEANFAEMDEDMLLMAHVREVETKHVWFLDSGCSNHMCGVLEWFIEMDKNFRQNVKLGDDRRMIVEGKGKIRLEVDGRNHTITDVYYVPGLKNNLLSVGQLQQKGLRFVFENEMCKVWHVQQQRPIMYSQMTKNRMFIILASVREKAKERDLVCFQVGEESNTLWHKRFGHLNYLNIKKLADKEMVKGLPKLKHDEEGVCEICMRGKQNRLSIPKQSQWRSTRSLQLVHTDICGPITPTSTSGKRYIINFIDDYTRRCWTFFLSQKSEAFGVFKEFKAAVEKELGEVLACLRSDRGGEYNSQEFDEYCRRNGIKRQLSVAYTPQQNGIAERKNRSVMNMTRCMLLGGRVPRRFWPEAVEYAVHVLNRSPSRALEDMTPEEKLRKIKPRVDHLKVFGCVAYALVPYERRIKLDEKSIKCVMFGISRESKAYRLYNPDTKKIIISKDVVFDETELWDWENNQPETELMWSDDEKERDELQTANEGNEIQEVRNSGFSGSEAINGETNRGDEGRNSLIENENLMRNRVGNAQAQNTQAQNPQVIESMEIARREEGNNGRAIDEGESSLRGRASNRPRQRPNWMRDYWISNSGFGITEENEDDFALFMSPDDPESFEEAEQERVWIEAMKAEIKSIEENNTWELVDKPEGVKVIGVKWVYKTKLNEKGEVDKHKARLVAKGYHQRQGVDFQEVFAPVARWDTIRLILAVAAEKNWKIFQLDVKSAFLQGDLEEEVFVEQPKGFEVVNEENKVYKLRKALYGLKQAPRAWYSRIESHFVKEGFVKCFCEHTLFVKREEGEILIVSLYVDDLIFTGSSISMMKRFKDSMMSEFSMSDLGKMKFFLGVEVVQDEEGVFINQKKYAEEIIKRYGMNGCNPVKNPIVPGNKLTKKGRGESVDPTEFKQLVGSLRYLTVTRPDLIYSVNLISRFMEAPNEEHMLAAKRVVRYVKGTIELGIRYRRRGSQKLVGYTDSDYAGDLDDRKSTSGYVFLMGNGAVSWASKKQPIVTLSTTEAEYVSAAYGACQGVWLRNVLEEIGCWQEKPTTLFCDNSSTIKLSKNPVMHGRSKHIHIRYHFLRELVSDGTIQLEYCSTEKQISDAMTKAVKLDTFERLRSLMGVCLEED